MSQVARLVIVAAMEGSDAVSKKILGLGDVAESVDRKMSTLQTTIRSLFGALAIGGLVRYTDGYTNLQNKLAIVTSGTQDLAQTMDRLLGVSNATRSSFEDTAKLYQRVSLAGREMKSTSEQNLRVTETLNKAIIVSGASSIEASNAMIQLSQGLAKGVLNGDELRSVLEQLPFVADLIVQEFNRMDKSANVTRGALREMGAEGKITSQIVYNSLLNAGTSIDQLFANTQVTVSQAMVVLRNSVMSLLGGINSSTGAMGAIASLILLVSSNVDVFAAALASAGLAYAVFTAATSQGAAFVLLRTAIASVIPVLAGLSAGTLTLSGLMTLMQARVTALTASLLAMTFSNPFTAIALALATALPFLIMFKDQIYLTADGSVTLGTVMSAAWAIIKLGLQSVIPLIQGFGSIIVSLVVPAVQTLFQFVGVLVSVFNTLITSLVGNVDSATMLKVAVIGVISVFAPWVGLGLAVLDFLQKIDPGLQLTSKLVAYLGDVIGVFIRLALTPFLLGLDALVNALSRLGAVTKEASDKVHVTIMRFLDLRSAMERTGSTATTMNNSLRASAPATEMLSGSTEKLSKNTNKASKEVEKLNTTTKALKPTTTAMSWAMDDATASTNSARGSADNFSGRLTDLQGKLAATTKALFSYSSAAASASNASSSFPQVISDKQKTISTPYSSGSFVSYNDAIARSGVPNMSNFTSINEQGQTVRRTAADTAFNPAFSMSGTYDGKLMSKQAVIDKMKRTFLEDQARTNARFHNGGIFNSGQGEGLAWLKDQEEILTPRDPRHSYNEPRMRQSQESWGGGGAAPVVNNNFVIPAGVHSQAQMRNIQSRLQRDIASTQRRSEVRGRG